MDKMAGCSCVCVCLVTVVCQSVGRGINIFLSVVLLGILCGTADPVMTVCFYAFALATATHLLGLKDKLIGILLTEIMGGAEPTLYRGSVWYTPIVEEWYYQVEVLKLEVGNQNLNLDCREYNMDKAIVDSGTTLLRLPVNVFNAVVEAITRSSLIQFSSGFWDGTKLACWMKGETPWRFFPKLSIYLRSTNTSQSFRITILPQLYIQPITDVALDCFRFGVSSSANGLVIGATVMEGFYVVFDRAQRRLGFALSDCAVTDGVPLSEISGPFSAADVAADCSGSLLKEPLLWVISYVLIAVCAVVLILLLLLLILPCRGRNRSGEITDESSLVRHRIK